MLRILQRFVRFAPGPVRLAWAATPRRVQDAFGPFIHPIAAGPRRGALVLDVPERTPPRFFDVVVEPESLAQSAVFVAELGRRGHRIIELGPESLLDTTKRRRVLDALYVGVTDGGGSRSAAAKRLGYRIYVPNRDAFGGNGAARPDAQAEDAVSRAFPTISIVIVTHSNAELCRACLASVAKNSSWPKLELVVVDNGSTDSTRQMLEAVRDRNPDIKVIYNRENHGFSTAANQGIRASGGEFVVLLNDDAAVGPGWLSRLLARFESNERFGLVCPITNETNNLARIPVDYKTFAEMEAFAERRAFDYAGAWRETEVISLFCALTRRSILEDVGLLDERFAVGMFEDDDLSLSLKKRGFDLGIALDAFVHHVGQASFSRLGDSEYLALWEANRRRYEEKWGVRWHPPRRDPA
jgi:GT2 family glycosyltransferase